MSMFSILCSIICNVSNPIQSKAGCCCCSLTARRFYKKVRRRRETERENGVDTFSWMIMCLRYISPRTKNTKMAPPTHFSFYIGNHDAITTVLSNNERRRMHANNQAHLPVGRALWVVSHHLLFYLASRVCRSAGTLMIIFGSRRVHCWHYVGLHFALRILLLVHCDVGAFVVNPVKISFSNARMPMMIIF